MSNEVSRTFATVLQNLKLLERSHHCSSTPQHDSRPQDLSFGGYFIDNSGKAMVGDDGLNGVELGPALEVTRGWKPADRLAVYTGGSGTDTLSFIYVVQEVGSCEICVHAEVHVDVFMLSYLLHMFYGDRWHGWVLVIERGGLGEEPRTH